MDCYRHPGSEAAATCVACGQPICEECCEEVAGHPMCHPCVAATQARLSQPEVPAAAGGVPPAARIVYGRRPGMGRRILRGMLWGVLYGQWWTLWTIFSMFLWGHASLDGGLVLAVVVMFVIFGFFGNLTGLVIGAANANVSTGMAIGIGAGVLLCLLQALLAHSAGSLVNLLFYFITGRFVGLGITGRVQQPVFSDQPASAAGAAGPGT